MLCKLHTSVCLGITEYNIVSISHITLAIDILQLEDILKLRHIIKSTSMDYDLKKAALEQAAIILQGKM